MIDRAKSSKNQPKATIPSTNLFEDGRCRRRLMFLIVVLASLAIDVAWKIWATASLSDRPIRFGPLTLRLIHNRGIAFSVAGSRLPPAG